MDSNEIATELERLAALLRGNPQRAQSASAHRVAYTPAEAAEASGVSLDTIRRAYRDGSLVCHYRSPRRPVILKEDLVAWLEAAQTTRPSD
jgi:DNA-directed RNA polymerase specialized sigma24 family protein